MQHLEEVSFFYRHMLVQHISFHPLELIHKDCRIDKFHLTIISNLIGMYRLNIVCRIHFSFLHLPLKNLSNPHIYRFEAISILHCKSQVRRFQHFIMALYILGRLSKNHPQALSHLSYIQLISTLDHIVHQHLQELLVLCMVSSFGIHLFDLKFDQLCMYQYSTISFLLLHLILSMDHRLCNTLYCQDIENHHMFLDSNIYLQDLDVKILGMLCMFHLLPKSQFLCIL